LQTRLFPNPEASTGFEPVIEVLQTSALPLGHDAGIKKADVRSKIDDCCDNLQSSISNLRAGDGTRTRDLLLGKQTFYQLNHARTGVPRARIELATPQFSVACSTN
jgi:hypothetical protein